MTTSYAKKLLCTILSLSLVSNSAFANGLPYTFQNERKQIDLSTYGEAVGSMSEDEQRFFETLLVEPARETADLLLLLETLEARTRQLESENINVEQRVLTASQKTDVIIELPEIGTARFTVLGYGPSARIFTQVHVYRSNTIYNLVDLDIVNPFEWEGAHVRKDLTTYIETDETGYQKVRQYIVVTKRDGSQELLTEEAFRVKSRHLKMWKEYYTQKNAQITTRTQRHDSFIPIEFQNETGSKEGTEAFITAMIDEAKNRQTVIKHDHHHTRADFGIHSVNIFHRGSKLVKKEVLNAKKENSGVNSFKNYIRAIKESPNAEWEHWDQNRSLKTFNTGDFRTTWRSIFFQELLTIPLALILTPEAPHVGPLLTLTWGVVIGFYNKIYRNAQNYARTPAEKNIAVALVSLSYNYAFGILMFGLQGLNFMTIEGLATNALLWLNVWISSWAKVKFQAIPIARERSRLVPKELKILGIRIGWGPSDEAQTMSNITSAFKFMDLADKSVLFGPAELKLTLGKLLFISSGFLAHLAAIWYTNSHNLPEKNALMEEWMRYHTLRRPFMTKEELKNIQDINEITLKYPFTDRRIILPLVGIVQDILETVLILGYKVAIGIPKAGTAAYKHTERFLENRAYQRNLMACSNFFN